MAGTYSPTISDYSKFRPTFLLIQVYVSNKHRDRKDAVWVRPCRR